MGVKKIKGSRKRFEATEEILTFTERIGEFAKRNPYGIIGGVALVLAIIGAVWAINLHKVNKEKRAVLEYTLVLKDWPRNDPADAKVWGELIPRLQNYIEEHKGTRAAVDARLDLAKAYYRAKRYDEALKCGNELLQELQPESPLEPLVRYHLALTYEESGQADEAIRQWEIMAKMGIPELEREIHWHMAQLYADKGDYAKVIDEYEKALKALPGYPDEVLIQEELAFAKLKAGVVKENNAKRSEKQESEG